jgi:hypothetical protein
MANADPNKYFFMLDNFVLKGRKKLYPDRPYDLETMAVKQYVLLLCKFAT